MQEAESFKSLVKEVIKKAGISQTRKSRRLMDAWAAVCDESMREHTRVSGFRGGILEVAADSHTLLQELGGFRRAELADRLKQIMPGEITDVRFVIHRGP